jgi:thiamine pyrophosphokinase
MCSMRYCADGGSNVLYNGLTDVERLQYLPDIIHGDLDSIEPEIRQFYRYDMMNDCMFA